jgi:hypothetical protein
LLAARTWPERRPWFFNATVFSALEFQTVNGDVFRYLATRDLHLLHLGSSQMLGSGFGGAVEVLRFSWDAVKVVS